MLKITKRLQYKVIMVSAVLMFLSGLVQAGSYTLFENGQVRPLVMSADGRLLYAVNTPDNRLEIFHVKADGLSLAQSVPVGMGPVAVAVRNSSEVWVVNHLSDSISIIDTSTASAHLSRTLLVGDEPRDIVFAGDDRAFITTAHRGQNSPLDPQFFTPGLPRADVWVFDAKNLGTQLGGTPLTIVSLFTDTPRALAVSNDRSKVYVAGFHTGNRTTTVNEGSVCNGGATALQCQPNVAMSLFAPGGLPAPNANVLEGLIQPEEGLIVQYNGLNWVDELGRIWNDIVRFNLPDKDVFIIDAMAALPAEVTNSAVSGVGTILFNMVANPQNDKIYVTNTDANNAVRFEGSRPLPPAPGHDISTVQGNLHKARISVINTSGQVTPRHLNKHINYAVHPSPAGTAEKSLATPTDMVISADGQTLYVAAFGSSKVAVFNTAELESDSFVPGENHIELGEGGPSGLALDELNNKLYVLTRFNNTLLVIDTLTNRRQQVYALHNPEPPSVLVGRQFLYDARLTSSNGEASCSSCHVFGDLDSLAWDLGDPMGTLLNNPGPFALNFGNQIPILYQDFHPMKGPMSTQSLRGMANHGPMHWRGDRTGGNDEPSAQPDSGSFDEDAGFKKFNGAFEGLLGRSVPLDQNEMQAFTDFILQLNYPPNPVRNLDNSLTASQQDARDFYFGPVSDGVFNCNGCHVLDEALGFFGTDGRSSFEAETQHLKIPHLRNMYQKVGMFGMGPVDVGGNIGATFIGDGIFMGDQIRGFGYTKDGSVDTIDRFHNSPLFTFPGGQSQIDQMNDFMMAFDTEIKPVVGQQITLTSSNAPVVGTRINMFIGQAAAGNSELVVKARINNVARGWVYQSGVFVADSVSEPALAADQLAALATAENTITYMAVPLGSGRRMGIDRDEDNVLDSDDVCPALADNQLDSDNDTVGDACDVCTLVANTSQLDSNGDGYGNICDGDLNNDGITNSLDLGILQSVFFTADADADMNGDGFVNSLDLGLYQQVFFKAPGPSALAQ